MSARPVKGKRSDKTGKTKHVVAMKMSEEDMLQAAERKPLSHKGELCPFTAVYHK